MSVRAVALHVRWRLPRVSTADPETAVTPAYATSTHWIGGVKHARREWLRGWPCCCSGERVRRIMACGAPLTYDASAVTCKGCLREMRKGDVLASGPPVMTKPPDSGAPVAAAAVTEDGIAQIIAESDRLGAAFDKRTASMEQLSADDMRTVIR